MYSVKELQQKISDNFSKQIFEGTPSELYAPIGYTLSQGGKRLRPVLVLLACDLFGGDIDKAINPALSIEIFHNFTLLHDDIMDKAPIRRGADTVYKKWNTNIAILSGDAMFIKAYEYIIKADVNLLPDLLKLFNTTAIEVCEGQQFDMNFETLNDVSIDDYINMIRLKTAVLLGCSLKTGAIIAGANTNDLKNIYDFGVNIGIAFQLKDDLLDIYSDVDKFGKVSGGDIITNKKTFLYLKAFELAKDQRLAQLHKFFSLDESDSDIKISGVKAIYDELNIKAITIEKMQWFFDKALDNLKQINITADRKQNLLLYVEQLMERES
jgi:geranylgeranyl diphosphate synthase type II